MTQQPTPLTTDNDAQLHALFDQMCQAWTNGDARAYGDCFTPDMDYVSYDGYREQSRARMVESHDKLFRGVLYGSALVGDVESIRYLGDDVAVVHGTGSVQVAWRSGLPKRRLTRNTIVAVRDAADGWRCTAIHNGRVRPVGVPEPDSTVARVARLLVRASAALGLGRARTQDGSASAPA
jgi:uncharacterized protein (TIGR02246 family)